MADGSPVIQGNPGWTANSTQTPTRLSNSASSGDGTGLYLFGGATGDAMYAVARGGHQCGVKSYSYNGHGVLGVALPYENDDGVGVRGESITARGAGVLGRNPNWVGAWGSGSIGVVGQTTNNYGIGVDCPRSERSMRSANPHCDVAQVTSRRPAKAGSAHSRDCMTASKAATAS
jgi:hypothetical protein